MARCKFDPVHLGVVLAEDYLKGLDNLKVATGAMAGGRVCEVEVPKVG